jgi:hypothetical protein
MMILHGIISAPLLNHGGSKIMRRRIVGCGIRDLHIEF